MSAYGYGDSFIHVDKIEEMIENRKESIEDAKTIIKDICENDYMVESNRWLNHYKNLIDGQYSNLKSLQKSLEIAKTNKLNGIYESGFFSI